MEAVSRGCVGGMEVCSRMHCRKKVGVRFALWSRANLVCTSMALHRVMVGALLSMVQPTESTGALCAATRSEGAAVVAPLLAAGSAGDGRQYAMSLLCSGTSCDPGEKASDVVLCQEGDVVDQLKEGPDVHHVAGAVLMHPG